MQAEEEITGVQLYEEKIGKKIIDSLMKI